MIEQETILGQTFKDSQTYSDTAQRDEFSTEWAANDIVSQYLSEIRKPLRLNAEEKKLLGWKEEDGLFLDRYLTEKEETLLGEYIQNGQDKNDTAKNLLIKKNLPFAVMLARKYQGRGLPLLDLIEEANLGLRKTAGKFKPEKGRFTTYATDWIRAYIKKALMNQTRDIRIPIYVQKEIDQCHNTRRALTQSLGRVPTNREVAQKVGKPLEAVEKLLNYQAGDSFDENAEDHNYASWLKNRARNVILDGLLDEEQKKLITTFLDENKKALSARDRSTVIKNCGLGGSDKYTHEQLSRLHGFAPSNVDHIMDKFSKHFKEWLHNNKDVNDSSDLEL